MFGISFRNPFSWGHLRNLGALASAVIDCAPTVSVAAWASFSGLGYYYQTKAQQMLITSLGEANAQYQTQARFKVLTGLLDNVKYGMFKENYDMLDTICNMQWWQGKHDGDYCTLEGDVLQGYQYRSKGNDLSQWGDFFLYHSLTTIFAIISIKYIIQKLISRCSNQPAPAAIHPLPQEEELDEEDTISESDWERKSTEPSEGG